MANETFDPHSIPVVILCGGKGTRISEETKSRPKPMITVGEDPILLHVMKIYAAHGFNRFILCLGYKGEMIKQFFMNYDMLTRDFTLTLGTGAPELHGEPSLSNWQITFAETGQNAMTGARIRKAAKYINAPHFMVTYADGVSDVDITKLFAFHLAHGKIGTVSGVRPASQFGEMQINGDRVTAFSEKPQVNNRINGGFFVFKREFLDYLDPTDDCVLESAPLNKLTKDAQLNMYAHDGFWQCMDTHKDWNTLNDIWSSGNAPWKR